MSIGLRLDVRQSQNIVLTPQLQQAIRLLQLGNIELASVVDREVSENPFLARAESVASSAPARAEREPELTGAANLAPGRENRDDGWAPPATAPSADSKLRVASRNTSFEVGEASFEGRLVRAQTLAEHLRAQLTGVNGAEAMRATADQLVDWLQEDGYIRESDADLATAIGVPVQMVTEARELLLRCDPVGVGAVDLAQCLTAQVREVDRLDPAMVKLLANLHLVARADFAALQRVCEVDLEDVRDMITEIKALDPRPGLSFAPDEPVDAVPDVLVYRTGEGRYRIELNQATLPKVLVDRSYYGEISRTCREQRAREFVMERYQSATWLAKALDQRARTMLRVAKAIFARQLAFLDQGAEHLRPLVLRDIAAVTGFHESTVSRATADKYVATPRGTFPLRYFFTTAIAGTAGGETHSAEAIRQQIKKMIDGEVGENVLSDDQIVAALKGSGVVLARRTVAKYRESLGIPSSVQRRRSKALAS